MWLFDPLISAPLIGCSALGWACGLIGASLYLRRQSLLGETLSHASYPGIMLGALCASFMGIQNYLALDLLAALFAFAVALLGVYHGNFLNKKGFSEDVTCSFILASYMGVGILLASIVQFQAATFYLKMQSFLMGQAATMQLTHSYIYIVLALVTSILFLIFREPLLSLHFDVSHFKHSYSRTFAILLFAMIFALSSAVIVLGLRGVGVVLMPALLICPPVCAAQITNRTGLFFFLSALQGAAVCFIGILTGFWIENFFLVEGGSAIMLPSGPFIVLIAVAWTFILLLLSPSKGVLFQQMRSAAKRKSCLEEDILKSLFRREMPGCCIQQATACSMAFSLIQRQVRARSCYIRDALENLILQGFVQRLNDRFHLTIKGKQRTTKIVKLHALWTLYLTRELGMQQARLDLTANEIEKMLDLATTQRLLSLLNGGKNVSEEELFELICPNKPKRGLPCFSH